MYLLSLIIPIYNSENYLDNTITSIINQSIGFSNIELILVDDCSTDDSKKIIEKYAKKYNNIVPFYSNENHGYPGFGRNVGLKIATANYIMFMDHDDDLDNDICKKLYETITKENADIACCDTFINDPISKIKNNIKYTNGIETGEFVIINDDYIPLFESVSIWNKIFKKEIIDKNQIKFEENTYGDDLVFSLTYFLKSNKMIYLKDYFGYIWNCRTESLSHSVKKEHLLGLINAYRHMITVFKKENKLKLGNEILKGYVTFLLVQCSYLEDESSEIEKILKEIHDFEIEINSKKLNGKWSNTVNYFVLHEHYTTARMILKMTDKIRKIDFLRKINRKLN